VLKLGDALLLAPDSSPAEAPGAEVMSHGLIDESRIHEEAGPLEPVAPPAQSRGVAVVSSHPGGRAVQTADVAALERLSAGQALVQFRLVRSFNYSVSLLFHGAVPEFYVALYNDETLWRAVMSPDLESAEASFRHMQEQIVRMSDGEVRRAQLKAQNERLAKTIEQSEAHVQRLRNDIDRDASQTQLVSTRQHEVRKELAQLEAQKTSAQAQLNKALRQIHNLKTTNNEGIPHLQGRREEVLRK